MRFAYDVGGTKVKKNANGVERTGRINGLFDIPILRRAHARDRRWENPGQTVCTARRCNSCCVPRIGSGWVSQGTVAGVGTSEIGRSVNDCSQSGLSAQRRVRPMSRMIRLLTTARMLPALAVPLRN